MLIYHTANMQVIREVFPSCSDTDTTPLKMTHAKYLQNLKFCSESIWEKPEDWILISYFYVTNWHRPQAVG